MRSIGECATGILSALCEDLREEQAFPDAFYSARRSFLPAGSAGRDRYGQEQLARAPARWRCGPADMRNRGRQDLQKILPAPASVVLGRQAAAWAAAFTGWLACRGGV